MPNLFPDMSRDSYEGSDNFIYAAPVEKSDWEHMYAQALLCQQTDVRIRIIDSFESVNKNFAVLLREEHHHDDLMLETAAWLRMTLGFSGTIYAVPGKTGIPFSDIIACTAGAPRHLCKMFDLPKEEKKDGS